MQIMLALFTCVRVYVYEGRGGGKIFVKLSQVAYQSCNVSKYKIKIIGPGVRLRDTP